MAASLLFLLAPSAPAPSAPQTSAASDPSSAVCIEQMQVAFNPGFDMSRERKATVTTGGETGRLACIGSLEGQPVTGPGTIGLEGTAHGTCLGGEIVGTLRMTVPTATGQKHIELPVATGWQDGVGLSSSPPGRNALVQFVPSGGDCLNSPATKVQLVDEDVFSS